jgi:choline dehydrogenase
LKDGQISGLEEKHGPQHQRVANAAPVARLCRGQVEPAGRRPSDQPALSFGGKEESDPRAIVGGLRFARRLFDAPAVKRFLREVTLPGAQIQSDDELLDCARRNGGTCYHASCTCLMGQHR